MSQPVLLLVGAGPGNGLALLKRFGQAGYALGFIARNEQRLKSCRAELQEAGYTAEYVACDVAQPVSLRRALNRLMDTLGPPEVLLYNASVLKTAQPSRLDYEQLLEDFKVNVAGALVAAQVVLPHLREAGKGGLLFTGGGLALNPYKDLASLAMCKSALRALALMFRQEVAEQGIFVGTLTINGLVSESDEHYNPTAIAEAFYRLYTNPPDDFAGELVY